MGLIIVVFQAQDTIHPLLFLSVYWDNLWKSKVKCLFCCKVNSWILVAMSPLFSRLNFIHLPMCLLPFKIILCYLIFTVVKQSSFVWEKIFCTVLFSLKRRHDATAVEMQNNCAAVSSNSSLNWDSLTFPDGLSHQYLSEIWVARISE